jgi:ketosteroid isomerase-like protein
MFFAVRHRPTGSRLFSVASLLVAAFALLQTGCTAAAPPKVQTWKNSTGAEAYQRLFWQAVKQKDWLQVESHMASNFTYLSGAGSKDKQQTLDYLHSLELKDFSLGEINVNPSGSDAIVTYTITLVGTSSSSDARATRQMAVWQQQKSGWVMVALADTK